MSCFVLDLNYLASDSAPRFVVVALFVDFVDFDPWTAIRCANLDFTLFALFL